MVWYEPDWYTISACGRPTTKTMYVVAPTQCMVEKYLYSYVVYVARLCVFSCFYRVPFLNVSGSRDIISSGVHFRTSTELYGGRRLLP